ncbi:hypothetical protein M378DRAFT_180970 [Amanita muscaria Koide BX008]|uniref:DUF6699 domain-containing protein n=1 Tax=Amanita muscaria (strain Koide BX008) TaxID=946122 RepID=A0A0C2WS27_AMAMK|nr:hypothetical protein M378DRAFT_180970 [Amanita muscaria Koide BX008]
MASYLRNLFSSRKKSGSDDKSQKYKRSVTVSAIPVPTLNHVYAEPGTVPPTPIPQRVRERSNSNNVAAHAITPSPLRYTTYDPGSVREKNRSASKEQPQSATHGSYSKHHRGLSDPLTHYAQSPIYQTPARPRSSSHKLPERPPLYPLYAPSGSFSSVYSTASTTSRANSSTGHPTRPVLPPRSTSATSVAVSDQSRGEPKSVLKRDSTWSGSSSKSSHRPHVSFLNPNKPPTLIMHPLLAYSRLHRPPICFDVTYAPSSCAVLDRSTLNPVPPHTLTQPATEPPTYSRLVLRCDKLPWPVVVNSQTESYQAPPANGRKFYIGSSSSSSSHSRRNSSAAITNLDILFALHSTLSVRVTSTEWEALGKGSRAQRKVTRAYEKRCQKMGGGWEGGVRRLDYLGQKKILVGIELDKTSNDNGGTGKLVFGKP